MRSFGSPSVVSRSWVKASTCLMITAWGLSCFLWGAFPSALASVNVTQILGGASDSYVPPPPPCTTFGFTEEATLTLPTGFNNGVFLRTMTNPYNNIGYAITEDGGGQRIVTFDLTSMTVRSSLTLGTFPGKYRSALRVQGDIDTADSRLYVFREARNGGGSCTGGAGGNCISFARFTDNQLSSFAEAITGPDASANIDDARQHGPHKFLIINNPAVNRRLELFDKVSLIKDGNGSDFGIASFGHLSRTFSGHLYGCLIDAIGTCRRIPSGSATSDATFNYSGLMGGNLISSNLYGGLPGDQATPVPQIAIETTESGVASRRVYLRASDQVFTAANSYAITDGSALFQGSFYDAINNKVFSARNEGGAIRLIRSTPGPTTFTVEQTFACVACNMNTGSSTGTQVVDYAPHKMRLFTISLASPAVITRIRVCATGGPPA